jgi:hypothetical protein
LRDRQRQEAKDNAEHQVELVTHDKVVKEKRKACLEMARDKLRKAKIARCEVAQPLAQALPALTSPDLAASAAEVASAGGDETAAAQAGN